MNFPTLLALAGHEIGLIFGLAGIAVGVAIVIAAMYFHHQRRVLWHETARIALEKGQPLPPNFGQDDTSCRSHATPADDIRGGLISIAVGAGLYLFFVGFGMGPLRFVGAIPAFVGIAMLLFGITAALRQKKNN
jgi:hypothetical protein